MSSPAPAPESRLNGKMRFDVYEADTRAGVLRKHGLRISLEERPFRALLLLLENANEVVTRDELRKQLWPSDVFIDFEHGLNTAIRKIRRALNDNADEPRFVETVARRGYRFIATVEKACLEDVSAAISPSAAPETVKTRSFLSPQRYRIRGLWKIAGALLAGFVLLAGSLAMYRLTRQAAVLPFNTQQMRVRQVTEHGVARFASISPDGRYIVYVKRNGVNPSLRVQQIATGSDIEVVPPQDGSFLSTISFSPDSNYIYFGHNSKENVALFDLYSVPILGGTIRHVLSDIAGASVSPDGTRIAFVRRDPVNARTALMVVNSDGSGQTELAVRGSKSGFMGDMPAWSPSGRFVAVVAIHDGNEAVREIVVVPAAGGGPHSLLGQRTFGQLTWLNDQSLLVASFDFSAGFSPGSDRAQIWYYPFPAGEAVRFSNDTNHYTQIGMTAARDELVSVKQDMSNKVFVASAANPADKHPVTREKISGFDLDWISNNRLVVQDENNHFYTIDADGSNRTVLFDQFSAQSANHCGDHGVVFNRLDSKNAVTLSVFDLQTGSLRSLARGSFNMGGSCSPDGKWVYYTSFDSSPSRLMKISSSGGEAVPVGPPASQIPMVSPNGTMLLFQTTEGKGSARHVFFAVMRTSDGSILGKWPLPPAIGGFTWGPDDKSFVYTHRVGDETALWQQALRGGEARRITGTGYPAPEGIWSFAYSPDGKRLALIQGAETRDVVLFTNFRK
jgi:DNA-binding winged helix-turn-helix (wHTH) protein/Tol biopolymer transport system component